MKISVAVATFNASDYIEEQISSIRSQTVPVDQIIISDDSSSLSHVELLRKLAKKYPEIILIENSINKGITKNFEAALYECHGEIIFLCDQDDIWLPNKVERTIKEFHQQPNCNLILSDAFLFFSNEKAIYGKKQDYFKKREAVSTVFCTGCCMALRREFLDVVLPMPDREYAHDVWINDIANAIGCRHVFSEPLLLYRRHGSNMSDHISSWARQSLFRRVKKELKWSRDRSREARDSLLRTRQLFERLSTFEQTRKGASEGHQLRSELSRLQELMVLHEKRIYLLEGSPIVRWFLFLKFFISNERPKPYGLRGLLKDLL